MAQVSQNVSMLLCLPHLALSVLHLALGVHPAGLHHVCVLCLQPGLGWTVSSLLSLRDSTAAFLVFFMFCRLKLSESLTAAESLSHWTGVSHGNV